MQLQILSELAAAVNGTSGKTGVTASLGIDKSTMTLISDDGYDIVVENYQLVGVTGPTMNISGADEDFNNLPMGQPNSLMGLLIIILQFQSQREPTPIP